jgi:hypothetical protein
MKGKSTMSSNNGTSKNIRSLLGLDDDMNTAISNWSAGEANKVNVEKAEMTAAALKARDYSCYEYLIWITDYSLQEAFTCKGLQAARTAYKGIQLPPDYAVLNKSYMWLAVSEVFSTFLRWKSTRDKYVKRKYDMVNTHFRQLIPGYGEEAVWTLLERNIARTGPVFGLELALRYKNSPGVDIQEMINIWNDQTCRVLRGCPEYLAVCPFLKQAIKENEDGVFTALIASSHP